MINPISCHQLSSWVNQCKHKHVLRRELKSLSVILSPICLTCGNSDSADSELTRKTIVKPYLFLVQRKMQSFHFSFFMLSKRIKQKYANIAISAQASNGPNTPFWSISFSYLRTNDSTTFLLVGEPHQVSRALTLAYLPKLLRTVQLSLSNEREPSGRGGGEVGTEVNSAVKQDGVLLKVSLLRWIITSNDGSLSS